MFRRGNFSIKYKEYAKSLKLVKGRIWPENGNRVPEHVAEKCKTILKTVQVAQLSSKVAKQCRLALSTIQSKKPLATQHEQNLKVALGQAEFLKMRKNQIAMAAGVPLIGGNNVITMSGYTSYDFNILKQLGIASGDGVKDEGVNVASDTLGASNDSSAINTPFTNASDVPTQTEFSPPSIYDYKDDYKSIFDNMPPEHARNDIYTTISRTWDSFGSTDTNKTNLTDNELNYVSQNYIEVDESTYLTQVDESTNLTQFNEVTDSVESVMTGTNLSASVSSSHVDVITSSVDNKISILESGPIVIEPIPEPPAIPDAAAEAASQLNAYGEPLFSSIGLGGWTPVGIVQNCFEYLHVSLGIPWWEAICLGTLVIRLAMFPLVIIAQRNAARMNNYMPQMQMIQLKMTEARQSGNQLEAARFSQELMLFMKEKQLNPLKNMVVPLAQMPVFISFFIGLREMANIPVDSLRTGGLFWFTDLTVPDQFFALPIITSLTLWATIELGTDSAKLSAQNMQLMKYFLRALPIVIIPFTMNFPGAILCYWMSSNFISLAQVGVLRIPAVRDYFNIEAHLKHNPQNLPIKNKGFIGGIKESWTNVKITKELEERRRLDEMQFQRAGKGPLVKTYKYDPTKINKQQIRAKSN